MFLVDTNVFLEILLKQAKKESCKKFLGDKYLKSKYNRFFSALYWCNPVQIQ